MRIYRLIFNNIIDDDIFYKKIKIILDFFEQMIYNTNKYFFIKILLKFYKDSFDNQIFSVDMLLMNFLSGRRYYLWKNLWKKQ